MDSRKLVLKETVLMAVGQALCVAVMLGVFALLGRFDRAVLLGGILGGVLTTLNHFFLSLGVMMAADKAEREDVKGGQALIGLSSTLRLALLFVIMFALLRAGVCNLFALVLPLLFGRPILMVAGFFRKDGEVNP